MRLKMKLRDRMRLAEEPLFELLGFADQQQFEQVEEQRRQQANRMPKRNELLRPDKNMTVV